MKHVYGILVASTAMSMSCGGGSESIGANETIRQESMHDEEMHDHVDVFNAFRVDGEFSGASLDNIERMRRATDRLGEISICLLVSLIGCCSRGSTSMPLDDAGGSSTGFDS